MVLILVTGTFFVMNQVSASQFSIQLESSKAPDLTRYAHLGEYGNLYKVNAGRGFVRTRLGPFVNKLVTIDMLEKVRAAGHVDAFITNYPDNDSAISGDVTQLKDTSKHVAGKRYDIDNFDVKSLKEWKLLTSEQQTNLVYLNGSLHVKNGSEFTPLYEIIRNIE